MDAKELIEMCNQVLDGEHTDIDNYVAAEHVCRHVLSTVTEDDDEPITEGWLLANGAKHHKYENRGDPELIRTLPKYEDDTYWLEFQPYFNRVVICRMSDMYDETTPPDRVMVPCSTRGQLRQLLKALGAKQ